MDDCRSIWPCVPHNIHNLGNYHAGIYVFWNVSIIWENTRSIFVFCKFTFVTSVSLGSLFFIINYRAKIFILFFTKRLFKNIGPNNICTPRLFTIIFVILFWTPTQIIIWEASGISYFVMCTLYSCSWLLLVWASIDAGAELQSGALGWMSLAQNKAPKFPDLPTHGLFKFIRQPIYASFALTTWTTPNWTLDQLLIAAVFTAYCIIAPKFKEKRFEKRFGKKFTNYQSQVPYMVPSFSGDKQTSH